MAVLDGSFAGFWTDSPDPETKLAALLSEGAVNDGEAVLLRNFIESGYAIIENAVNQELCDALREEIGQGRGRGGQGVYPITEIPDSRAQH